MLHHLAVLIALSLTPLATGQDDGGGTTIDAPEAGFRLVIPDLGWAHETRAGAAGLEAIGIGPREREGMVQLTIVISAVGASDPDSARAEVTRIRAAVAADTTISGVDDFEFAIAGRTAPGLRLHQAALGQVFDVRLVFLRAQGMQYRIQFHAPRDEFDGFWATAQTILQSFELVALDDAAVERTRLQQLAARCGSQVDWAPSWADASARAQRDGRLVVVAVYAQPGFSLGHALNEQVFTAPEVLGLMTHRFVGWRWNAGEDAPFVDHDVFGLSGTTFGVGLLVCTPDGAVVRQIFLPEPSLVAEGLRDVLREHADVASAPSAPAGTATEQIAFLIDSGQLTAARTALATEDASSPSIALQAARLARYERDGVAALAALDATTPEARDTPEHRLERARILMGLGRTEAARTTIRQCLAEDAPASIVAEALLVDGALAWAGGDRENTRERWSQLTRDHPDEPSAWVAAAGLVGPALAIDMEPDLSWPSPVASHLARLPRPSAGDVVPGPALVSAANWLMGSQRADGGWDIPYGIRDAHPAPSSLELATEAICTLALARSAHAWTVAEPELAQRCRAAAHHGLLRYLEDRRLGRHHPRPVAFMDYTCWSSSYGLFCLTAIADPGLGMTRDLDPAVRDEIEHEMAYLVEDLVRIQNENGGWSYYLSGEVDGNVIGAAMSFTTATVLLALQAAQDAGLDVPAEVLERGAACLASMRGTNGVWAYMRIGPQAFVPGEVAPAGAAARGPVCTLALCRAGVLEAQDMTPALRIYVDHLDGFGREARKALMHAGPAGQGSHYLLYDYATAAEAMNQIGDAIDPAVRAEARAAILTQLARCHNADGSFVDNPILGAAPGTGLAVLALLDLGSER